MALVKTEGKQKRAKPDAVGGKVRVMIAPPKRKRRQIRALTPAIAHSLPLARCINLRLSAFRAFALSVGTIGRNQSIRKGNAAFPSRIGWLALSKTAARCSVTNVASSKNGNRLHVSLMNPLRMTARSPCVASRGVNRERLLIREGIRDVHRSYIL